MSVIWSHLARSVVGMLGQFVVHTLQTESVCDFTHRETGFIQDGDDSFVRLLHKIHDDLIAEVFNLQNKNPNF